MFTLILTSLYNTYIFFIFFLQIFMSDVRFLDHYIADQNQYLVVSFRDGRKQHVRGPSSLFLDPVVHKSIKVEEAISLNAFEAIVVYCEEDSDRDGRTIDAEGSSHKGASEGSSKKPVTVAKAINGQSDGQNGRSVHRRIVRGPTLFIPAANEWVHRFTWHGPSNNSNVEDRTLVKDSLKLTKIRTLPDQLYYNVNACRTSDDAQLCVKLMVCKYALLFILIEYFVFKFIDYFVIFTSLCVLAPLF